jgi:hypothetical protein
MLSKVQKVILKHSLKVAKRMKINNSILYLQTKPSRDEFQMYNSMFTIERDRETIETVIPVELQDLVLKCPNRIIDGDILHNLICSAYRNPKLEIVSSSIQGREDLAFELFKVLSSQVHKSSIKSLTLVKIFSFDFGVFTVSSLLILLDDSFSFRLRFQKLQALR